MPYILPGNETNKTVSKAIWTIAICNDLLMPSTVIYNKKRKKRKTKTIQNGLYVFVHVFNIALVCSKESDDFGKNSGIS